MQHTSAMLLLTLVACLAFPCGAARMKRGHMVHRAVDVQCPDDAVRNSKGDCVNSKMDPVDEQCCATLDACKEKIQELMATHEQRLHTYVRVCSLKQSSWVWNQEDGTATIDDEGSEKVCSKQCQGSEELSQTLETVDLESLRKECGNVGLLDMFERYLAMVTAADSAWKACSKTTPEVITTEAPTTTEPEVIITTGDPATTTEAPTSTEFTTSKVISTTTLTGTDLFEPIDDDELHSVFVIDTSGSMSKKTNFYDEHGWELSRLDVVKHELTRVIEELSEDHFFGVVAFSSSGRSMYLNFLSQQWFKANPRNKARAAWWIDSLYASGGTPMKHAMQAALKFEGVDAVHLLGDGEPTDCYLLEDCLGGFHQRVPIHTTLFVPGETEAASASARKLLKGIAAKTLGKFREPYPPVDAPLPDPGDHYGECRPFCMDEIDCQMLPLICGGCGWCGFEYSMCDISCNRQSDCLLHPGYCAGCSFCF